MGDQQKEYEFSGPRGLRKGAVKGSDRRCRFVIKTSHPENPPTHSVHDEGIRDDLDGGKKDDHDERRTSDHNERRTSDHDAFVPFPPWDPHEEAQNNPIGDEQIVVGDHHHTVVGPTGPLSSASSGVVMLRRGNRGRFTSLTDEINESHESNDVPPKDSKRKKKRKAPDESWIIGENGAPRGPSTGEVIPSFGGHVALRLWGGVDRGLIECHSREKALVELAKWRIEDQVACSFIGKSRIEHLRDCMLTHLNFPLLCAFVERWQPDTNTFHLPFGEMTIMLHDVYYILRIPVDGEVVAGSGSANDIMLDMVELLSMSSDDLLRAEGGKAPYKGGGVMFDVIRRRCGRPEASPHT